MFIATCRRTTEEEIREVPRQVAVYAGFPTAWNGLATASDIFNKRAGGS